jgi:hypothetical protein
MNRETNNELGVSAEVTRDISEASGCVSSQNKHQMGFQNSYSSGMVQPVSSNSGGNSQHFKPTTDLLKKYTRTSANQSQQKGI